MAINILNSKWLVLAMVSLAAVAGCCCQAVPLPGENQCPTDARRLYCTCGEEAVRRCPCGPGSEFYGLKPTCWREWPEGWHCNGYDGIPCGNEGSCGETVAEAPVAELPEIEETVVEAPAEEKINTSNPFRAKANAAELPLPPKAPEVAVPQNAPAKAAPVQLSPPQPTPTTAPATSEPAPMPKQSESDPPSVKATSVTIEEKTAPAIVPQIAPVAPQPLQMPAPAALPITTKPAAAIPQLNAPENAPKQAPAVKQSLFTKPVLPQPKTSKIEPAAKPIASEPNPVVQASAIVELEATTGENPKPEKSPESNPELSDRVEQHLLKNLRL